MDNTDQQSQPEREGITKSKKELGVDEFANRVAQFEDQTPHQMLEALTRDAMTFTSVEMMLSTFSILHVKLSEQADKQADKADNQAGKVVALTQKLHGLTRWLWGLTAFLIAETTALVCIAAHTDLQIEKIYQIASKEGQRETK